MFKMTPFATPTTGTAKDGRPQKDVQGWTTKALNDLACDWKDEQEKDAAEIGYDSYKIPTWRWGIGGRDAMRAGWTKDVGDLQYINESYRDPSEAPFSWWYASVAAQMKEKMRLAQRCLYLQSQL